MSNFPHRIKHILTDPLVIQLRDVDAIAGKCGKRMRQLGWLRFRGFHKIQKTERH